jgi:hypothetical protein
LLQRDRNDPSGVQGDVSALVDPVLQRGGRPLDASTRAFMEPRFGHDFSRVRIHADGEAARSAESIHARAYTHGENIVFGESQYAPGTSTGTELLAHELAHTVQQGAALPFAAPAEGASSIGVQRSARVQRDPNTLAPAAAPAETYTLTLTDGVHTNITKIEALALLSGAEASLKRGVDFNAGEWGEINKSRLSFFGAIGGALTDLAGKNFPSYEETWAGVDNALIKARQELRAGNVKGAGDQLVAANAAYEKGKARWDAYKAQLENAGTRAQIGIAVVAVVAVAVFVTGGLITAPAAAAAGTGGAGAAGAAGVAGGGGVVAGGGVGGAAALGATAPVDAAAAGLATTGVAGGGGAVVGGGAGAGSAAALGTTAAAGGSGAGTAVAAGAAGTATAVGVGGATADAIVGAAIADTSAALSSGGVAAATATAEGMSVGVLEAVYSRLVIVLGMNAPLVSKEAQALKQVADIVFEVWHRKVGFPGVGG